MKPGFVVLAFGAVVVWLVWAGGAVKAGDSLMNLKLSGMMPDTADVIQARLSPDGQTAVFMADVVTDNAFELYSVPVDGSAEPTLLSSGLLPSGTMVEAFAIAPDGSRVVYVAAQDTTDVLELYSVPMGGGTSVKLNPTITAVNGGVLSCCFKISQDSSRVIFLTDWEFENDFELFSVPIDGGTPVRLNSDLPPNGAVVDFELSQDGSRVVYLAYQDAFNILELFAVPVAGGAKYQLNDTLVPGGNVYNFVISPDSSQVVYVADQEMQGVWELYVVPLADPTADAVKLNPPLVANGDVAYYQLEISPDSSMVAYLADQDVDGMNELYAVPLAGGTAVKLNDPLAESIDLINCSFFDCFHFSPDSSRVVYMTEQDTADIRELYSAHIVGTSSVVTKLNETITTVGRHINSFEISPDGSRVVYSGNVNPGVNEEIFSVPIEGGPVAKLNGALVAGGAVLSYALSPDSSRVVYVAIQQTASVSELYSVPLTDGPVTKLNPPLVDGGAVYLNFEIAPDSNHVLYQAEQETDNVAELFVSFTEVPVETHVIYLPVVIR
ncbi:MAG: hypothetical protein H6658_06420 [Ardenticatenaceae bacterium]|nr:hypothetical protein [Ardenticatenaceae bacterium]